MRIIMLGAPGAGKGTQAKMIADKYGLPHVSTGDIFRANIKAGTELGNKAKEYMDKGFLVPDELTVEILLERVSEPDCKDGYILDGFPRTIPQAEVLDQELNKRNEKIDYVIDIEVEDDAIVKRMAGRRACLNCGATFHVVNVPPKKEGICDRCGNGLVQRKDDEEETVKGRLAVYHKQTQPLIAYYTKQGALKAVNGADTVDHIFARIVNAVEE